jgi:DNA-binding NtrC family response regulator
MIYKILVLDSNEGDRKQFVKELESRKMNAIGVSSFEEAKELLLKDGLIHVVLSDWEVLAKKSGQKKIKSSDLFKNISTIRYEVNIFLLSNETRVEKIMSEGIFKRLFLQIGTRLR